jgi:hypothetical protein
LTSLRNAPRLIVAWLAFVGAGCACLSAKQADAKREKLYASNRDRAEPAMRAAAEAQGAVLLPIEASNLILPLDCAGEENEPEPPAGGVEHDACGFIARATHSCINRTGDRRTFVLRHPGGSPKLVIPIAAEGWRYTRLARRGDTLFILRADITPHTVGRVTECECDGMPRVVCPTTYGFILDEVSNLQIKEVSVPMTDDTLDWSCRAWAV